MQLFSCYKKAGESKCDLVPRQTPTAPTHPGPHNPGPYLVFLGSRGPLPCSFLTNISLLLRMTSRIFPRELLRWRVPLPSWTQRHKPGRWLNGTDQALVCCT